MPETVQQTFPFAVSQQPAAAPAAPRLPDRLKTATQPDMVMVAPGRYMPRAGCEAPEVCLAHWRQNPDGTFSPAPFQERMARLSHKLCAMLGFPGQFETLRRLARAGNIELIKISPQVYLLNIDSWFNHLRRCAEDPDLWDKDGAMYRHYVQSQGWTLRGTRKAASGLRKRVATDKPGKAPGGRFLPGVRGGATPERRKAKS